jgi:hypothetical protein
VAAGRQTCRTAARSPGRTEVLRHASAPSMQYSLNEDAGRRTRPAMLNLSLADGDRVRAVGRAHPQRYGSEPLERQVTIVLAEEAQKPFVVL